MEEEEFQIHKIESETEAKLGPTSTDGEPENSETGYSEMVTPSRRRGIRLQKPNIKIPNILKNISRPSLPRPSRATFSFKKKPMFITLGGFALLILIVGFFLTPTSKNSSASLKSDKKAEIPDAKNRQLISQNFDFPIKDSANKDVTKIHYSIENAELHDQIIVSGQRATAITGKTFLVINLKITNDFDKPIQLNTKDYIRLTRNDSPEQLAADIHNDPVTIQPISTKYTRLGFAINDGDKNIQLRVGEINGQKTTINIKF